MSREGSAREERRFRRQDQKDTLKRQKYNDAYLSGLQEEARVERVEEARSREAWEVARKEVGEVGGGIQKLGTWEEEWRAQKFVKCEEKWRARKAKEEEKEKEEGEKKEEAEKKEKEEREKARKAKQDREMERWMERWGPQGTWAKARKADNDEKAIQNLRVRNFDFQAAVKVGKHYAFDSCVFFL